MMKMMGWTEGEGLGVGAEGITAPIEVKNESINREGLGSQAINSDNISREEAETLIRDYAGSDSIEDLIFASDLNFDERKEIRIMAKRYGLSERIHMEKEQWGRRCFLVLSKKISSEAILDQLEREGSWGKYELVRPRGMTKCEAFARYLCFQGLRREYGLPGELRESCRNSFAPPQFSGGGDSSSNWGFGRGGASRGGRGFGRNERAGFQGSHSGFGGNDITSTGGGQGSNLSSRGSGKGSSRGEHSFGSSHRGGGSFGRGGQSSGVQSFGRGSWVGGQVSGGHREGSRSAGRNDYSLSSGGSSGGEWNEHNDGPSQNFNSGGRGDFGGQDFGMVGGEEYSPTGMLRMGAMRGRIMDRMRGGGNGGSLMNMEEEKRM